MKAKTILLCFFLLPITFSITHAQESAFIDNGSFEDYPRAGVTDGRAPQYWYDCGPKEETSPDIHGYDAYGELTSNFGVDQEPAEGNTYLGLVTRANDTWEAVSQKLKTPLQEGKKYKLTIALSTAPDMMSFTQSSNSEEPFDAPTILVVGGGNDYCSRDGLFIETAPIENTEWLDYEMEIIPGKDYKYLILEAYYSSLSANPTNGNILLDDLRLEEIE